MNKLSLLVSLVFGGTSAQAPGAASSQRCQLPAVSAGGPLTTITHDGIGRSWYTYVPASVADAQAVVPLVVDLHGYGSDYEFGGCAVIEQKASGWLTKAEEFGVIVVWPQAAVEPISVGAQNTAWNAGACCRFAVDSAGFGPADDVDDVSFLREMVGQVAAVHPVDANRIYFSGHSNGCMMAQRMLAQASDLVAAVACFAGYLLAEPSPGYAPRPVMTIQGTADPVVPYTAAANIGWPNPGAEENLASWGGFNGCPGVASTETALSSYTLHELDCNGVVSKLVELPGVGHYVFAAPEKNPLYNATVDGLGASFDTTQLAWDFVRVASIAVPIPCPADCVPVDARQRRQLLFGSFLVECPKGCVPA
jgi:polyhydroxybutyrate depolymerase